MSETTIRNTIYPDSLYLNYSGLHKVFFDEGSKHKPFGIANSEKVDDNSEDIYTDELLMSDTHKILFSPNIGLFNFYNISLGLLFSEIYKHKNFIILIDPSGLGFEKDYAYFHFFLKSLDDANIKWKMFDTPEKFYINNFSLPKNEIISPERINKVYNFYKKYILNKDVKPFRKVYLSRSHMEVRDYFWIKDGLSTKADDRLYDHKILEEYLEGLGFEVIVPEQKFVNFQDQINYFNETKLLVSLSSSGISNSLFMQPNTTVTELITTYPLPLGYIVFEEDKTKKFDALEQVHHIYHNQAYLKNQAYFGIPNRTRYSSDIIDSIENNSYLSYIFKEG